MKSRWRIAGLVGLAAIVALAFQPWELAERTVEQHLLKQLSRDLGVELQGAATGAFAVLPVPRIVANDVTVSLQETGLKARIPRLRADISLLALLGGNIVFDHVTLLAPEIEVEFPQQGLDVLAMISSDAASRWPAMPRITIENNGSVFFRRGPGIVSSVRDINVDLAARAAGEAVQFSGSLAWRGETLRFAIATNSAGRSVLPMARIRSDLVNVDFASRRAAAAKGPGVLDGDISIAAASMSRLGSWLASGSPVLLPLGKTALAGALTVSASGAQVAEATLTLGADSLEGALDWRQRDGRWRLTGTFAGKSLDIGQPQSGIDGRRFGLPDLVANAPIEIDDLLAHDVDLRLSLQRIRLPGLNLTDVAGQILATDQRLDVSIANAGFYRGVLRGRASMGRSADGIEMRGQISADRVDLGLMSGDLFEQRRMTGVAALQQTIEMSGRTPQQLLASATGRLNVTARNGDFAGTNLTDIMRRIERQPLAVARDWRGGRTSFEQLHLSGMIANGVLNMTDGTISGPAYRVALLGQVSLLERILRLAGQVQPVAGNATVPFDITGPLGDPSVQINARALLERSGAAAPFYLRQAN